GYDKVLRFYKENSYYLPNFFYYSFARTFDKDLFSEWVKFERYISNEVYSRKFTNEFSRVTYDGCQKWNLKIYRSFLVYSQSQKKGELPSVKYFSIASKKTDFLIYGRYVRGFDIKDDLIAFIEVISSKYFTRSILKVARLVDEGVKLVLKDEREIPGVDGVYKVSIVDTNTILVLSENDLSYKVSKVSLLDSSVENIFESDFLCRDIDSDGVYVAIVCSESGRDVLKVFLRDSLELIREVRNFEFILDLYLFDGKITFSGMDDNKMDVFQYDILQDKVSKVVSGLFSILNPVVYGDKIYGISFSEDGFDIFFTKFIYQDFTGVRNDIVWVEKNLRNVVSSRSNVDISHIKRKSYSYFNDITPFSILMSFFPDLVFSPDFSIKKLGVLFSFYDEPLEFRNFFIDLLWNFDSRTIDYSLYFYESGVPYLILKFGIFRDHVDTNSYVTRRLNSRGYDYEFFTFDYLSLGISGDFGNTYIRFYPFSIFSVYSFAGKDSLDNPLPGYRFYSSYDSIFSSYVTFGYTLSTLRSSLGAVAPEEGIVYNLSFKIASKGIGSIEDVLIVNKFFSYSFRLFANNVISSSYGLRLNFSRDLSNAFSYSRYRYTEVFPKEEGNIYEFDLVSYGDYPDNGDGYLTLMLKAYLKFFEVNEGIWPFYITSVWSEFGVRSGILFNFTDIVSRRLVFEFFGGLFLYLNLTGSMDNKVGIEVVYNPEGDFFVWNFGLSFDFGFDLPF
ncbi:MAG: hypothetical protein ACK4F9_03235, partial [Brevinematia bacterium]